MCCVPCCLLACCLLSLQLTPHSLATRPLALQSGYHLSREDRAYDPTVHDECDPLYLAVALRRADMVKILLADYMEDEKTVKWSISSTNGLNTG